jgi:NADH-quinone oxidoreductase subunit N
VSLLVFAAIATAAAAAAYATRNGRRAGTLVGFAGLLLTLGAALAIEAGDRFEAAGGAIEATAYGRLFVLVGLTSAILVLVIARLTAWQRNAPAAVLGGAVSLALGLASPEAAIGLLACGGAALVATLVALVAPLTPSRVRVLAREVRGAAVGLVLGLAAVSLVPGSSVTAPVGRVVAGTALLAAVAAVAQRLASVPFHSRASRLAETAPALGLPLLLAWIPAAWAVVLLEWAGGAIAPVSGGVDLERLLVGILAVATVVLGTAAALAQDEIEKATAYAVVAGGGLVILAFAALDPAARDGMRAWLPAFVAAAAGLAGWTIAIRGAFGTGRVDDLAGWIRRAPVLAAALVGIGVALLGWPGAATWDARAAVVAGVVGSPAPVLAVVVGIVPLLALVRLVVVGAARPGSAAIAAPAERPRWGDAVLGAGRGATLRQATPPAAGPEVPDGPPDDGAGRAGSVPAIEGMAGPFPAGEGPADDAHVDDDPADDAGEHGSERPSEHPADDPPTSPGAPWRGRAGRALGAHRARGHRLALPAILARHSRAPGGERSDESPATAARYLLDANRVPIRSAVVLLLALTTLLAAAGAFDLREAAAEPAPRAVAAQSSAQP